MWCSVVGGAGVVRGSVVMRGVCCGGVWCVMDRYHPDSLKAKKCLPLPGILPCGVPSLYFLLALQCRYSLKCLS